MGDHTETLQIDFDPTKISYAELLKIFWGTHNACRRAYNRQYMSAIFYFGDTQKKLALETKANVETEMKSQAHTLILPLEKFYMAEDYHQKYMLQNEKDLMTEYRAMYPNFPDFVNSTSASRLNGYLAGHGKKSEVEKEFSQLGLSDGLRDKVISRIQR